MGRVFFLPSDGGVLLHKKRGRSNQKRSLFFRSFFRTEKKRESKLPFPLQKTKQNKNKKKKRRKKKRHRANHHFCHARIRTHARAFFSDPSISISLCVFIQYAFTSWESEQLESACVFWNKIRESSHSTFLLFFRLLLSVRLRLWIAKTSEEE